jgi:Bcr/CflA subfamily drug resistance transporter
MSSRKHAIIPNIIVPIAGMSTDIYLPSMPAMVEVFHTSIAEIQLTLSAYVFGMGVSQLLAGPVSDSLGRKKQILVSLMLQLVTLIFILNTTSIKALIIARFCQGLGAGFMVVPARAILNDCFEGEELRRKFNYLTISFALAPIIAPFIGGYCEYYYGYQASFFFIFLYALILLLMVIFLIGETLIERKVFSFKYMWVNYKTILSNKTYVLGTCFVCVLFGFTSIFNALGPFLYQDHFHFSAVTYGYIALCIGLAWFLGNVSNRVIEGISVSKKIRVCLLLQCIISLIFISLAYCGVLSARVTSFLIFVVVYLTGVIFPNMVAECLMLFPKKAASANACFFSLIWLAFSAYTLVATQISFTTLVPFCIIFLFINILAQVIYRVLSKEGAVQHN